MSNHHAAPVMADASEVCLPCYLDRYAEEVEAWRVAALRRRSLRPPAVLPRRARAS